MHSSYPAPDGGMIVFLARLLPGRRMEELESVFRSTIDSFLAAPLDESVVSAAKRRYVASAIRDLEVNDRASDLLARTAAEQGSARSLIASLDAFEQVNAAQVLGVARTYLASDRQMIARRVGRQ
jgi:predicted Zn-dependent peptidase